MKCSKCGAEITDIKKPCKKCGHVVTEQEDMNSIIKNILKEDDHKRKFENSSLEDTVVGKLPSSKLKPKTKTKIPEKTKPTIKSTEATKSKTVQKQATSKGKTSNGDVVVEGLRYLLVGLILLFTLSMFFNWMTLKGNAVNQGLIRTEEIKPFINESIRESSIENLETYDGEIVTFSAMDLYKFSDAIGDSYKTIMGPSGMEHTSMLSQIQKYYMKSIIVMIFVNVLSIVILLLFKSLKGISIVRNLSILNFAIIGLNYLSLRIPFFSMIAVKAKDLLGQTVKHPKIAITRVGISMNDTNYAYEFYEERGFIIAVVVLGLWLLVGITLSEVKHRREEIAIDNGEL